MSSFRPVFASICIAVAFASAPAMAAPVSYSFVTSNGPLGSPEISGLLGSSAYVVGTFKYDASAPATGTALEYGYGSAVAYGRPYFSYFDISGSVSGLNFSDPWGSSVVGNDMTDYPGRPAGQDWLGLNADRGPNAGANVRDPSAPYDFRGFSIGGYTLVNMRMFWFEGINGLPDFLTTTALPAELPKLHARLALDFVRTDDPTNLANAPYYSNGVFFDGIQVTPVPEPETYAMMLAGLGLLGVAARRRKQKSVA
jgi:hypothetical protein